MVSVDRFYDQLASHGFEFFTGVPDSLLKDFCAYVTIKVSPDKHVITANEGSAVALAAGYHLATGKLPVVYLQNSGLGNVVNPLVSLIAPEVYRVPMLFIIGWRGEPGVKDEPQHIKQGLIMEPLLRALDLTFDIVSQETSTTDVLIEQAVSQMRETGRSHVFLVRKETFSKFNLAKEETKLVLSREEAIGLVLDSMTDQDRLVSTTGMVSREVFEHRVRTGRGHAYDFLTVGSMGHSSQIALGLALNSDRRIFCLDGDGAVLMHMGGMATIGARRPKNLYHIVLNNGAHDSVGGQPTVAFAIDLQKIAEGCGYSKAWLARDAEEARIALRSMKNEHGPVFLEIRVKKGNRPDLGRPTTSTISNKQQFMASL